MLFGKITVEFAENAFVILTADFIIDQSIGIEQAGPFALGQKLQAFACESDAAIRCKRYFATASGGPVLLGGFTQGFIQWAFRTTTILVAEFAQIETALAPDTGLRPGEVTR